MTARTRRIIPVGIVPGLHTESGHHRTGAAQDFGCNERRKLNLYRPGRVRLTPARRVSPGEWEVTR